MVHEAGHPEPWIIALSQAPSVHTAFDYGLRWGIEAMFSDFKSRGFGLEDSQIRLPGRLDRLILVMALALFWAGHRQLDWLWSLQGTRRPVTRMLMPERPRR